MMTHNDTAAPLAEKHSADIQTYCDLSTVMHEFARANGRLTDPTQWTPKDPRTLGQDLPEGVSGDGFLLQAHYATDALGRKRTVLFGHQAGDADHYYVWLSPVGLARTQPQPMLISRVGDHFAVEHHGQRIPNTHFMYDHQYRAVSEYSAALAKNGNTTDPALTHSRQVVVFATGTGKSYIVAHTLKAMGGQGVVIAADRLGTQMAADLRRVMNDPPVPVHLGSEYTTPEAIATLPRDGVVVIEAKDLKRFLDPLTVNGKELPGFLTDPARPQHVCIDEAHEFTMKPAGSDATEAAGVKHLQALAQYNDVLAITATPTRELYEALSVKDEPASSITMYSALHELPERPFRPLQMELTQVGNLSDEERKTGYSNPIVREQTHRSIEKQMRMEALAGYFGRDEYIAPDYYQLNGVAHERGDNYERYQSPRNFTTAQENELKMLSAAADPVISTPALQKMDWFQRGKVPPDIQAEAVIEAMKANQVRYSAHKGFTFAVRNELVKNLAHDFQAIHDGSFAAEDMAALTAEVWKRRAQSAIVEYIRMSQRDFEHVPEAVKAVLHEKGLDEIYTIPDTELPQGDAQQRLDEAKRRINPDDFKEILPDLFKELIGTPADINLTKEAKDASRRTALEGKQRRELAQHYKIDVDDARKYQVKKQCPEIDMHDASADPRYYALAVVGDVPGKERVFDMNGTQLFQADGKTPLTGTDVQGMVKRGEVVQVVNNYSFTTGFSDADQFHVTRIVENIGDYIVRATQMMGRPVRAKDGVAAVHEIVGPYINLHGELGVDKHFSCYDVVSKDYIAKTQEFTDKWRASGHTLWGAPYKEVAGAMAVQQVAGEVPELGK